MKYLFEDFFLVRDHPFSTYAKFLEYLTFLCPWYAHVRVHIRGREMLVFRKNFAYVLNGWSLNLGISAGNFQIKLSVNLTKIKRAKNLKRYRALLTMRRSQMNSYRKIILQLLLTVKKFLRNLRILQISITEGRKFHLGNTVTFWQGSKNCLIICK